MADLVASQQVACWLHTQGRGRPVRARGRTERRAWRTRRRGSAVAGQARALRTRCWGGLAREAYLRSLARCRSRRRRLTGCAPLLSPPAKMMCGRGRECVEERDGRLFGSPLRTDANWVCSLPILLDPLFFT